MDEKPVAPRATPPDQKRVARAIADVCWEIGKNFGGGREDTSGVRRKLRALAALRDQKGKCP